MGGGLRDGWNSREKGERHVIICRSWTSPVNPQSRLTWLIKEAIKGSPPEILRDERKKDKGQRERNMGPNGEKERRGGGEGSVVIFVIVHMLNFPVGLEDKPLTRLLISA